MLKTPASAEESEALVHLLEASAGGDRAAFRTLYDRTSGQLYAITLRILRQRELADEALQEAYVTIWRKAGLYRPERGKPLAWMATVARNQAIDQLRRQQAIPQAAQGWDEPVAAGIAATLFKGELPREIVLSVRQCVESLEINQRKAVLLAYYYGATHEELAVQLDSPLGTVKSWVRRGLLQLKDCLDQ